MTKRVLVCGSRSIKPSLPAMRRWLREFGAATIVTGGANGVDHTAAQVASAENLRVEVYRPNYEAHGRRAPLVRNEEMLDTGVDLVFAVWDGESTGTAHTLSEARRRGIPTIVERVSRDAS